MRWKVTTDGGRRFGVLGPDEKMARAVAETCLKKGEEIAEIRGEEAEKQVGEKKEETASEVGEGESGEKEKGEEEDEEPALV